RPFTDSFHGACRRRTQRVAARGMCTKFLTVHLSQPAPPDSRGIHAGMPREHAISARLCYACEPLAWPERRLRAVTSGSTGGMSCVDVGFDPRPRQDLGLDHEPAGSACPDGFPGDAAHEPRPVAVAAESPETGPALRGRVLLHGQVGLCR